LHGVTDGDGNPQPDTHIAGTELQGLPIIKTLHRDSRRSLSAGEAWALNYYGGSVYGTPCYDPDSAVLYVPTGNGYSFPYSDQVAAIAANHPGSNMRLDAVFENYSTTLMNAHTTYLAGDTIRAFEIARQATSFWKDVEMRRKAIRGTRSPRYQRFFHDSIVALDAHNGRLQWGYPVLGHDQRDNSFDAQPRGLLSIYQELGTNNDLVGASITESDGSKFLLAHSKMAVGIYNLSSSDFGFVPSRADDPNGDAGILSMRVAEVRVDFFMKSGDADFGGFVVRDGMYFKMQTLWPIESGVHDGLLSYQPVLGDPLLYLRRNVGDPRMVLWAVDVVTQIRWVRIFDFKGNGGGITGYGNNLFVGLPDGMIHVVDMNSGTDVEILATASGATAGNPIVNGKLFHTGGHSGWGAPNTFAYFVEMLTPFGA